MIVESEVRHMIGEAQLKLPAWTSSQALLHFCMLTSYHVLFSTEDDKSHTQPHMLFCVVFVFIFMELM